MIHPLPSYLAQELNNLDNRIKIIKEDDFHRPTIFLTVQITLQHIIKDKIHHLYLNCDTLNETVTLYLNHYNYIKSPNTRLYHTDNPYEPYAIHAIHRAIITHATTLNHLP